MIVQDTEMGMLSKELKEIQDVLYVVEGESCILNKS
jgi:hypothetical protein